MEAGESTDTWRMITKQLLIRSIECILEGRFPEMASNPNNYDSPLNYPFHKNFSGKFGLKRDLKHFPDFNKLGEPNELLLNFYISPMNSKVSPRGELQENCENWGGRKTIESWRISLEINEASSEDDDVLIDCYTKILKAVNSKTKELPGCDFVDTFGKRMEELQHIFNYQLKLDPTSDAPSVESATACGVAGLKSKSKSTEFKFDIGFGYIKYEVEYITINSLAKIRKYLTRSFDPSYSRFEETKRNPDGSSDHSKSLISSEDSKGENYGELDESDDFILITTSDNFVDIKESEGEGGNRAKNIESNKHPSGQKDDEEDYTFDADELFKNKNPPSKRKMDTSLKQEEQQRKRLNSDTTACSRVRNTLGRLKLTENEKKPEVFEKKQFEFKNVVSPAYIDNLVINEGYFGKEQEPESEEEKLIHDDFEDEDFNPFKVPSRKVSDAFKSPNANQGPSFRGLREFRTSIDANDPTNKKPQTARRAGLTKKHRKFTLSFDGDNQKSQGVDESFVKLEEGTTYPYKLNSFRNKEEVIKEEDDISFEMELEDDYFTDDLADFIPHIDKSLMNTADTQGYEMVTQESAEKPKLPPAKMKEDLVEASSNFESILLSLGQAISDSAINNLNSSGDYCLFLNNMEDLRKRIDSRATDASCDSSSSRGRKSLTKSRDYNSETREQLLNNYIEIVELREKLTESTFDSILN